MEHIKELRASLYFSKRKDRDIIEELSFPYIEKGDINWKIKELMRDGIKYREMKYNKKEGVDHQNVRLRSVKQMADETAPSTDELFDNIRLNKIELDNKDIYDRLDNF